MKFNIWRQLNEKCHAEAPRMKLNKKAKHYVINRVIDVSRMVQV